MENQAINRHGEKSYVSSPASIMSEFRALEVKNFCLIQSLKYKFYIPVFIIFIEKLIASLYEEDPFSYI